MSILQSKLKYVGGIEVIYLFSFLFFVTWQTLCKKGLLEVRCMNFPLLVDFTLGNAGYVDLNYIKIWLKWQNAPPLKPFHLEDSDYITGLPVDVAGFRGSKRFLNATNSSQAKKRKLLSFKHRLCKQPSQLMGIYL